MKLEDVQPGAVIQDRSTGEVDVITVVNYPATGGPRTFDRHRGPMRPHSEFSHYFFLGNFRLDSAIELGPRIEYGEPRKEVSLSAEDLAKIHSLELEE